MASDLRKINNFSYLPIYEQKIKLFHFQVSAEFLKYTLKIDPLPSSLSTSILAPVLEIIFYEV